MEHVKSNTGVLTAQIKYKMQLKGQIMMLSNSREWVDVLDTKLLETDS